jgi:lysophospholipase L1-like esterase
MENELNKIQNAVYVNIFDSFLDKNDKIIDDYFLKDNLHLSSSGYNVWQEKIYAAIKKIFLTI